MDLFSIFAIFITTIVFVLLPLGIIYLIYRIIKRKYSIKTASIVSIISLIGLGYFIANSFFPSNSFYKNNFENNTNLKFPVNAILKEKQGTNSIYNSGGYNISYLIELPNNNYQILKDQLLNNGYKTETNYLESEENKRLLALNPELKIETIISKNFQFKNFELLFLNNEKSIICNSNKW